MEIFFTILIFIIVIALIVIGIIGIFVPILPDIFFILLAFFIYGIYDGFERVGFFTYFLLVGLAFLVVIIDYLATIIGARKFGVSKWGLLYGIIGGIIGIFVANILGFIVGFFLGIVFGELLQGKDMEKSLKSGSGAVLGFLGGNIVKVAIILLIIIIFIIAIIV
ncbi:MAG: DUF456 domain-containing protein [Parcubacteria group bacterium]|nr:DUF456 domain-containing protein [Parcubacteria group bacterium]